MTHRRRLIVVEAQVRAKRNLAQRGAKRNIRGRAVNRIPSDDHEQVDLAGVHVADQVAQRRELIGRLGLHRVGIDDGCSGIAERLVHRVRQRVHNRRLAVARDHEAGAAMRLEIFGDGGDPLERGVVRAGLADLADLKVGTTRSTDTNGRGDLPRDAFDLAGAQRPPVIGARAGGAGHALERVQPVHAIGLLGPAPRRKVARVADAAGPGCEEVRVERQNYIGLLEPVLHADGLAERQPRAAARVLAACRIPLMPFRRWVTREHVANLRRERRGAHRFGQDPQARAVERLLGGERSAEGAEKPRPWPDFAEIGERLRSIGIVETEHGGLREDVGGAEAARMQRVAFDLGRPALVALDEQAGGHAAERHRGGEEERPAENDFFGLAHVGHDLFRRLPRARGEAAERERRAHQFQERPARHRIGDRLDLRRELVVQEFLKRRIVGLFLERSPPLLRAAGRLVHR